MRPRVGRYSTNEYGYTFREWCELAGVELKGLCRELADVGPKEREAWKNGEDPADWHQANRLIREAKQLGMEADLTQSSEPPWHGKNLFTRRRRKAYLDGFHDALYSRTRNGHHEAMRAVDGEGFVGPGPKPCLYKHCGDYRCKHLQEKINERTVAEVMRR